MREQVRQPLKGTQEMTQELTSIIESAWDSRDQWNAETIAADQREAIMSVLAGLNNGSMRVAEKTAEGWLTHQWIKKAVLLSFRLMPNEVMKAGPFTWYDKLPVKFHDNDGQKISESGIRAIPGAIARYGSFIEPGAVLMPSFVNVGARVGSGTMVDTWATVGSCAQVGKNCHLSGGVGIGGVLEPVQAGPTIIEDNCFIGARSEIVEGVVVEENSVISMGVFIGQSTKIYDRTTGEILRGRVPAGSVVVPGSLPSKDGTYNLNCAVIVKRVDAKTRSKTSINDLLRD